MKAIDAYETAWAEGDFLTVESFFAADAKRLHTEPEVWDRQEIKRYFEERAAQLAENGQPIANTNWREEREYLDIQVSGDLAYDAFTTERFKAFHLWKKQDDGTWKIIYDMGMLNYPEQPPRVDVVREGQEETGGQVSSPRENTAHEAN